MLALNRNRQNLVATNILNRGSVPIRGMALAAICFMATPASLALAQGSDSGYRNPVANQLRSQAPMPPREPSILIRDESPVQPSITSTHPAVVQPVRPIVGSQPKSQPLQPQVSSSGFDIPSSPTREGFTNPNTDSVIRASASDGSAAVGTYAHESREPSDPFAEPQPPSAPIRSFGSTSAPVRVSQPPQPDHEPSPIVRNDLRSFDAASGSNDATTHSFGQHLEPQRTEPQVDSITASPAFVDTRPAPPAAMPGTSSERFNPQLFSQTQTAEPPEVKAQPVHSFTSEPSSTFDNQPTFDNQVAATSFSQAVTNPPANNNGDLAQQIVDRYSMDNTSEPLPGEPMKLKEMLQQPLPLQHRPAMVSQYWETWFDWASMQNAIAYQEWLATVPNASAQGEQGLLDAARSAAQNQALAAKIQLGKSQSKLVRYMPTRRSNLAPLPSDSPLVERYETHYEICLLYTSPSPRDRG